MKLVTADQTRILDQQATKAGLPVEQLIENAGQGVAEQVRGLLGTVQGRRIVVLSGPGNNGGDGLVAARCLYDWGAEVKVYLLTKRRPGDSNMAEIVKREIDVADAEDDPNFAALDAFFSDVELIVDALLGTGPQRPIEANLAAVLERVQRLRESLQAPRVVAVDLPTGVNSDTGAVDPKTVPADLTATLGFSKVGLHTLPGSQYAGRVEVVDIGLPEGSEESLRVELMTDDWIAGLLPERPAESNKGSFGRVLAVAGSENYIGAVRLAAQAAGRVGAGLVTIACPQCIQAIVAAGIDEATYLPLPDKDGGVSEKAVPDVLRALQTYDVLLIGPGLGGRPRTLEFVQTLLFSLKEDMPKASVVDADALNILGGVTGWSARIPARLVLTPHPGELRRLTGKTIADIQSDRLNAALTNATHWGQTVVLKGAHTVVAEDQGRAAVSPFANPALASAGTGDVLSGAIAGLLAQGLERFEAASCGVYLHAMAGENLRRTIGDAGLQASDLLLELPRAIHQLKTRIIPAAPERKPSLPRRRST
jgi:hydroxyethylthiazole kinase-like uncharacterized protein yjeF